MGDLDRSHIEFHMKTERIAQIIAGVVGAVCVAAAFLRQNLRWQGLAMGVFMIGGVIYAQMSIAKQRRALEDESEFERQRAEHKRVRESGRLVIWLGALCTAGMAWPMMTVLIDTSPMSSSTLSNTWGYVFLVLASLANFLTMRAVPDDKVFEGAPWRNVYGHTLVFLFLLFMSAAALPPLVAGISTTLRVELLDKSCGSPQMRDVAWLVIDSLAKGALVDFMESFHVDLHTCPANRHSWATSIIVFTIRMISTLGFVWYLSRLLKLYWGLLRSREAS
jgi:hypothetical protein